MYNGMKVCINEDVTIYDVSVNSDVKKYRIDISQKAKKGDKGDDGLSAYEIAVAHGFVGDEESWLRSISMDWAENEF